MKQNLIEFFMVILMIVITITVGACLLFGVLAAGNVLFDCGHVNCSIKN